MVGLKTDCKDRAERAAGTKCTAKSDVWETVGLPVLVFLLAQHG